MGVPKFFRWISERYPCLSDVVREYQIPDFDNLYLDMNGIIHNCSHPNDEDIHFRISEEKVFQDIFRYIEFLFRMIKPRKVFFMAIDGVAPRAKMNQQRGRRFRSAKEAEVKEKEALERGETLPEEKRFDSNCITPGTEFMDRLHQHLKYFVSNKITTDDLWRNVKVILSGHETPGEGEHKIMDFIRCEKSQPNYDPNTRHCLYGLDADLMMLGLCSHEPHFSLLREEVVYNKSKADKNKRDSNPEAITFHLLHLSLFREYIGHEFSQLKTSLANSFGFNLENIIDDWVLMGFLVGNDFIPHIPHFHINKSSLLKLYEVYKRVLPTLDGYLNENGNLNLKRFQKYINALKEIDLDNFNDTYADLKYFESKTGRKLFKRDLEDTSAFFAPNGCEANVLSPSHEVIDLESESEDWEDNESSASDTFSEEFRIHKRDYYMTKLKYPDVDDRVLKEQAYEYIRAIQWNLHYYYDGCVSWSWYYPHHYAPYISDVNDFDEIDLTYDRGEPFRPFEQLLAVLPSASKDLLPNAFKPLVSNPNSPLIDCYPEDFETDMNEKQQAWEAVVLIPFIDEKRLLDAVIKLEKNLSKDEVRRNRRGPHLVFTYSPERVDAMDSPNLAVFPQLVVNHAKCLALDSEAFVLPIRRIHKGLCPGVRLDIYFPGFPTLQHISHDIALKKERVRVFQSASMGENMMLYIKNENTYEIQDVIKNYLNETVFVNWPHLLEARVFKVTDSEHKYTIKNDSIVCEELEDREYNEICIRVKAMTNRYKERWGVVIGRTDIVLHVYTMTGLRYIPGFDGRVTLEKEWSSAPMYCPIQTVVKDIPIFDNPLQQFQTIGQLFPKDCKCFLIDNPYYGSVANVIESIPDMGLIRVEVNPESEPDLREIQDRAKEIINEHYYPNFVLAQRLGISAHLLSRITGAILVVHPTDNQRKVNIGLNLKFNKNNEEIPGFSIKRDDNWLFSEKIFNIMNEYLTKYPFIFDRLSKIVDQDNFTVNDLIPGDNKPKTLEEVINWLRGLPSAQEKRQKCNAEILDEFVVEAIEDVINTHIVFPKEMPKVIETYKPNQLYRPIHYMGFSPPDPNANFNLFDRVVNVRSGIPVPLGAKGTIIGKHLDETNEVNTLYDIVFDEAFVGGTKLRCSSGKGYKLSPASLINITYGLKSSGKYEQFIISGQPLQTRTKHNLNYSNRQTLYPRDQNNLRFQFGYHYGQRMPRPRLENFQNMPQFVSRPVTNTQTSISIQALNHSKNSPFQSPKHESQKTEEFPPMDQLWNALGMKSHDNSLPKGSFAAITANKRLPEKSILPESTQLTEQMDKNKSNPRVRTQKTHENRRTENFVQTSGQQRSTKPKFQLYESYRNMLSNACERYYNNLRPTFETIENMSLKSIRLTLPDGHSFYVLLNAYKTLEDAYDAVSREALELINRKFAANYQLIRPQRLLSSPAFLVPNQTSPNRPKISVNALPPPPPEWIQRKDHRKTVNESVVRLDTNPEIPDSFVVFNEMKLKGLEKEKRITASKVNLNTSGNRERHLQPKKLFDRSENVVNNSIYNQKSNHNRNNRKIQNNSFTDNNPQRRHTPSAFTAHASTFDHQFVPLQVARNNQSHRHPTPQSSSQKPIAKTCIEIASTSSDEVEILTPESIVHLSNPSSGAKDDIEILTPDSLNNTPSGASGRQKSRKPRIGVNFS